MKITNKLGLPEPLVQAVSQRTPEGYSASMLTQSPRMVWLKRRHWDELERDVSEMIWSVFGTAVHAIIEKGETANSIQEAFFKEEVMPDVFISGIADVYENGKISDWKTTSVWTLVFLDDAKIFEYTSQLNVYAWLYRKAGFKVTDLEAVMMFRDWQARKAKFDKMYPLIQVYKLPVRLWSDEKIEAHIQDRIRKFESFKNTPDDELPECTTADRWVKPSKWALMKEGRKSAVKLYNEKPDMELEPKHYWEERKAEEWKRCDYCDAWAFCNQTGRTE